jgi:hypothetical protein
MRFVSNGLVASISFNERRVHATSEMRQGWGYMNAPLLSRVLDDNGRACCVLSLLLTFPARWVQVEEASPCAIRTTPTLTTTVIYVLPINAAFKAGSNVTSTWRRSS